MILPIFWRCGHLYRSLQFLHIYTYAYMHALSLVQNKMSLGSTQYKLTATLWPL